MDEELELEGLEELEDFELNKRPISYEIWLLGYDKDYNANDFEFLVDDGYTELFEAQKCFDYFLDPQNLKDYLELKGVKIDEGTAHVNLFLEECADIPYEDSTITECQDILDEQEVKIF
jgi:hypothetical protein